MTPELSLLHVHGGNIGYGRLGVCLAAALADRGVDVYDVLDAPVESHKLAHQILEREGGREKQTNVVCWVSVPTHARGWWEGQHVAIFTMWEATQLPESFRETLHEFDTVCVPSLQNVELFGQYHDNVNYVPLGVDPKLWHYTPRNESDLFFRFLIGGSGKRKGVHEAYDAFQKVFGDWVGDGPIPRLVMKSPKGACDCDDCLKVGRDWHAENIEIVPGKLTAEEEIDLYAQAHCYLQPSYGEGFGLQPLQAIAQGCPTILTNAHGHEAYAHLGRPIDSRLTKAAYFIYGDAGQWWEPDFDQLCEQMRDVYDNYDRALGKAKMSARIVARDWTWDKTAARFQAVFGDEFTTPFHGTDRWIKPDVRRYLTMVNEARVYDIAGDKYYFEPGIEYYEMADVKRILFEAGRLDPKCLTGWGVEAGSATDLGLTEKQVALIPDYTAAHAYCPTCNQRLNSSPTHADEIFEDLQRQAMAG